VRRVLIAWGLVAALAAALDGCSGAARRPSTAARANRTHEVPTPVPRQTVPGAAPGAAEAVRVFATAYINWTASTVTARLRTLASLSIRQARSAMTLAASETAHDYELHRSGIANSGTVEAVASLPGSTTRYVVVTLERTTASKTDAYSGLEPAWHVALAGVTRVPGGGWAVSSWQPEN
jgi:hypothetical protein